MIRALASASSASGCEARRAQPRPRVLPAWRTKVSLPTRSRWLARALAKGWRRVRWRTRVCKRFKTLDPGPESRLQTASDAAERPHPSHIYILPRKRGNPHVAYNRDRHECTPPPPPPSPVSRHPCWGHDCAHFKLRAAPTLIDFLLFCQIGSLAARRAEVRERGSRERPWRVAMHASSSSY